jgi:DNA (cytosine-5)-methyltransferase 1
MGLEVHRHGKGKGARKSLSLYTGAGGLDLGLESAGFVPVGCVEMDADCRKTLLRNRPSWPLAEPGNVHAHTAEGLLASFNIAEGELAICAAGAPCQPWSKAAYWRNGDSGRLDDPRAKTLHAFIDIVEVALPDVVLLENVRGLGYRGKDEGLRLIREEFNRINRGRGSEYRPQELHINAADYGVPQQRERLFVLATRDGDQLTLPEPTHGDGRQHTATTAWDAIWDFDSDSIADELVATGKWAGLLPSIPEGMNYLWHTPRGGGEPLFGWRTRFWTFLLKLAKAQPSWTVQAHPGPSTGPFHWRSRRLSITEMCGIQTFPAGYEIVGSYHSARRQAGNAVPSAIGELLGLEIRRQLYGEHVRRRLHLIPDHRDDCPAPEAVAAVPRKYRGLRGEHPDHPGAGLGPGARKRATAREPRPALVPAPA